jgi:hypothetical protein
VKLAPRIILVVLGLVAALWLRSVFFPSAETAIRKHLARTARAASFIANELPMDQLRNIGEFSQCFSPDVEVKFESPGSGSWSFSGRKALMAAAAEARAKATAAKVEFLDASVVVAPDHETATADLTVRATIPGDRDFVVQEMKFYLKKFGRAWLIIRAESVKTLSGA